MKSFKLLLSFIVLAAVAAAPVVRADTTPSSSSSSVKLTPAQEAKITELRKEESKALKALKADTKTKEADKKAKAKSIKEDFDTKIAAVKAGS